MDKKYEITGIKHPIYNLYRIRAIKDFGKVKKGDLGGYIEAESNLSQEGGCWISGDARVRSYARVSWDAQIYGNALVEGKAFVSGQAKIYGNATFSGDAQIYGNAQVYEDAQVYCACICNNARVYGNASICEKAEVLDNAKIYGNAYVSGQAKIYGNAEVYEDAQVSGNAEVFENAHICGVAKISYLMAIGSDLKIQSTKQVLFLHGSFPLTATAGGFIRIYSRYHSIEYWLKNYKEIGIKCGRSEEEIQEYKDCIDLCAKRFG